MRMTQSETLPAYNPGKNCAKCGKTHTTWRLVASTQDGNLVVRHSFCPTITPKGEMLNLCMECKMVDKGTLRGEPVRRQ